jgi:hypothetical protein
MWLVGIMLADSLSNCPSVSSPYVVLMSFTRAYQSQ